MENTDSRHMYACMKMAHKYTFEGHDRPYVAAQVLKEPVVAADGAGAQQTLSECMLSTHKLAFLLNARTLRNFLESW